jgi:hypothetical protein
MRNFARTICVLAVLTAAAPVLEQTSAATAFDGTYRGISRHLEGATFGRTTKACPAPTGPPAPLRIVNGIARAGPKENPIEGSVTA